VSARNTPEAKRARRETRCRKHVPRFSARVAATMTTEAVQRAFPRFFGACSDCGFVGIAYASDLHAIAGGWLRPPFMVSAEMKAQLRREVGA
jgi:hypothetical protein